MTTPDVLVRHTTAQLGASEDPLGSNNTRYGIEFGWNYVAWCQEFVDDMFRDVGVPLPVKTAACVVAYDYAESRGFLRTDQHNVAPADEVIRTWTGKSRHQSGFDAEYTHAQVVTGYDPSTGIISLIGGNQGPGVVSRDSVHVNDSTILGVLKWSTLFTKPVQAASTETKGKMPLAPSHLYPKSILGPGSTGDLVKRLQNKLIERLPHAVDNFNLRVSGIFGTNTEQAVKAFQKMENITVDGDVGPTTYLKLGGI